MEMQNSTYQYKKFRLVTVAQNIVLVQPQQTQQDQHNQTNIPILNIDLKRQTCRVGSGPPLKNCQIVWGIFGILKLSGSVIVTVIEEAKKVTDIRGKSLYQITRTRSYTCSDFLTTSATDVRLGTNYQQILDAKVYGKYYFSFDYDLTLSQQRNYEHNQLLQEQESVQQTVAQQPQWTISDPLYFWNIELMQPLREIGATEYILPVIQGHVQEIQFQIPNKRQPGKLQLLARRSVRRLGTRLWRRGADRQGAVANYVETELIVSVNAGELYSYVQVRGSMPFLWSQIPNTKYKPQTFISSMEQSKVTFFRHFSMLQEIYKSVICINLANQSGTEGKLTQMYYEQSRQYSQHLGVQQKNENTSQFKLVNFDFHKVCKGGKYEKLSQLWGQIKKDYDIFKYFVMGNSSQPAVMQKGVFRTNCVDCLDRTNVVQTMIFRHYLEDILRQQKLLNTSQGLPEGLPKLEQSFKILFADLGDEISRQYTGTGAMKSGFTRYGKRDLWGLLDDGYKAVSRYYLNNYLDSSKQDALDIISGNVTVSKAHSSNISWQPSPVVPLIVIFVSLYLLGIKGSTYKQDAQGQGLTANVVSLDTQYLGLTMAIYLLIMASMIALLYRFGAYFVAKPTIRPDLIKQF